MDFRDKSDNLTASGMPPAAIKWLNTEELSCLCMRPYVREQIEAQIRLLPAKMTPLQGIYSFYINVTWWLVYRVSNNLLIHAKLGYPPLSVKT